MNEVKSYGANKRTKYVKLKFTQQKTNWMMLKVSIQNNKYRLS